MGNRNQVPKELIGMDYLHACNKLSNLGYYPIYSEYPCYYLYRYQEKIFLSTLHFLKYDFLKFLIKDLSSCISKNKVFQEKYTKNNNNFIIIITVDTFTEKVINVVY